MNKRELLKNLLKQAKSENLFIGSGNPDSNILIVGKEASISEDNKEQIEREITVSIEQWERDIDKQLSEVDYRGMFSPLYPYKGQLKKRDSNIRNPKAEYNWGTSVTWLNYQKVRDSILETNSDIINFHENCFITELNQITSRYSSHQNNDNGERSAMINKRLKTVFTSDYIQSFPVVIMACGTYVRQFGINIEKLFGVEQNQELKCVPGNNRQWYRVYHNLSGESPKLVIHTRQMSMNVTNALIEMIGKEISSFCKKNNISL